MHDIFKDALKGFAPKPADPREIEAALSETQPERARILSRITELEAILDRIHQRIKGKTQ